MNADLTKTDGCLSVANLIYFSLFFCKSKEFFFVVFGWIIYGLSDKAIFSDLTVLVTPVEIQCKKVDTHIYKEFESQTPQLNQLRPGLNDWKFVNKAMSGNLRKIFSISEKKNFELWIYSSHKRQSFAYPGKIKND